MSTKATFRALREEVGLSIPDLAHILGVHVQSIKRWENPDYTQVPPQMAWDALGEIMQKRDWIIESTLTDEFIKACKNHKVTLTYFRDQVEYDKYGRDEGNFKLANANSVAIARELKLAGCTDIEFCYPQEEGNVYQSSMKNGKINANDDNIRETSVDELEAESDYKYKLEDILQEVVRHDYRNNLLDFDKNIDEFMKVNYITSWDYDRVKDAYYKIADNFNTGEWTLDEQEKNGDISLEEALESWIPSCYCQDYTNDEHNIFDFLEESNLKLSEHPKVAEAYYKILNGFENEN